MAYFIGKSWYKSKTMWINILSIIIVTIQYFTDIHIISLELQIFITAIINIFLRYVTSTPIKKGGVI